MPTSAASRNPGGRIDAPAVVSRCVSGVQRDAGGTGGRRLRCCVREPGEHDVEGYRRTECIALAVRDAERTQALGDRVGLDILGDRVEAELTRQERSARAARDPDEIELPA